jgi:hypothetical protein
MTQRATWIPGVAFLFLIAGSVVTHSALAQPTFHFPPYPGAKHICSQHISGIPMHISWSSSGTPEQREKVIDFYKEVARKTKGVVFVKKAKDFTLRSPDGYTAVSVHVARGDHPKCDKEPPAGDRTVIIHSTSTKPAPPEEP